MTTHTLTGNLADRLGGTLNSPNGSPPKAYLVPASVAVTEAGEVRIGDLELTLDTGEAFTATVPDGIYRVRVDYFSEAEHQTVSWNSPAFQLAADLDLATIVVSDNSFTLDRPAIDHGAVTPGTLAVDAAYGLHELTITGTTDLTPTGPVGADMLLRVTQDVAGGHLLTVDGDAATINLGPSDVTHLLLADFATAGWTGFVIDGPTPVDPFVVTDGTAPTVPGSLAITGGATTSTGITITWADSTDNVAIDRYEVTNDNGATLHPVLYSYTKTWRFEGLAPSTSYTMKVRAVDLAGNASAWASVTGSTSAGAVDNPPAAPTGLAGTPSYNSIALTWTAATDDHAVVAYRVSIDAGVTWLTSSVIGTAYTLTGLARATTYAIRVQAGDAAGQWGASASLSSTTLTAVTDDSVIRLPLDEGAGLTSNNTAGTPDATIGSAPLWTVGHTGFAVAKFNDAAGAVRVDTSAAPIDLLANDGFTLIYWISTIDFGVGIQAWARYNHGDPNAPLFAVESTGPSGLVWRNLKTTIKLVAGVTTYTDALPADMPMQTDDWRPVAIKWTKATNQLKVFYNRALLATHAGGSALNGTMTDLHGSGNVNGVAPHGGTIDEIRLFTRAVSDSDIIALMDQTI